MQSWIPAKWKLVAKRRIVAPVLALALAASFATYESVKPVFARTLALEPTATPLSDDSVGPLLSLDKAMETLAARVTPAIVNVAVTSRTKPDLSLIHI